MSELIKHFGIDWKLLLAQAVNFFILLVILKKFAYGPVLKMLKKRKGEIERGLNLTKEAEERIRQIGEEREEVLKEARSGALSLVSEAERTAKIRKEEIAQEAVKKAENIIFEAKRMIEEEKSKMGEEVYKDAKELMRLGIAKVLGKMPSEERDEEFIKEALRELKTLHKSV